MPADIHYARAMSNDPVTPDALPWDGGCRCDRLRVRVTMPPLLSAACHCHGCQRMSASAFSLTLILPISGFEVLQGEPVVGGLQGVDAQHMFCDHCKTWVFTRAEQFGVVNLRPTMLDAASWFVPYIETYVSTKLAWATTPAFQSFDEFPPMESYVQLMADYADWARQRGWPAGAAP